MIIRRERPADRPAIDHVLAAAFADQAPDGTTPTEVALTRELFACDGYLPKLSLVAEIESVVVGFVICTRGHVGQTPALGLGPLATLPALQGRGIGQALMRAVIGAADALDEPLIALLGHTEYYPRFGFVPATSLSVRPSDPAWGAHFQALPLTEYSPDMAGTFRYAAPFGV